MKKVAESLLERYIIGKDQDRFALLEEMYAADARVTFAIETSSISFPSEIVGNKKIAQLLSADFNRKYDQVRTYYLSREFPNLGQLRITRQGWLVLMRERENRAIRIGTGHYNWQFTEHADAPMQIQHHHIYIDEMLCLPDHQLVFLTDLQKQFPYPWLPTEKAVKILGRSEELAVITDSLKKIVSA